MNFLNIVFDFFNHFWQQLQNAHWYEHVAVLTGIISVWFSKKENVLVYPLGLISTIIYVYLSFKFQLFGEATVNFYYTVMSIIGWYLWVKKDEHKQENFLHITYSTKKEIRIQSLFFTGLFVLFFIALKLAEKLFYDGVIPWADAFATATAFTGMYLMVKKKVESWYWWMATNIASIPLYYVKGLVVTSLYYLILLVLSIYGLQEWKKKAKKN
jgi:nicotinamide mononucleotide transporter